MSLRGSSSFLRVRYSKRKRNFVVISTLSTVLIVLGSHVFLATWSFGFLVAKILGSKETGNPSKIPSVILPLGICRVHLHHWLICSGVMAFVLPWFSPYFSPAVHYGFLGGVACKTYNCVGYQNTEEDIEGNGIVVVNSLHYNAAHASALPAIYNPSSGGFSLVANVTIDGENSANNNGVRFYGPSLIINSILFPICIYYFYHNML